MVWRKRINSDSRSCKQRVHRKVFFHLYRLLRSKYNESHIPKALEEIQSEDILSILSGLITLRKMASNKYDDSLTVIY